MLLLKVGSDGGVLEVTGVKQLGAPQAQFLAAPQEDWQVVLSEEQRGGSKTASVMNRVADGQWMGSYQAGDGGGQPVDLLDQAWLDCAQQPAR